MVYVKRDLEEKILKYLKRKEIIAIVGPRQCGKTTLMKHIYKSLKNTRFISFEDRDVLEMFVDDIKSFIQQYAEDVDYLFIDEFHYAKEGGKQLKYFYDHFNTKIIISGSSATELSIQGLRYLVGRIFIMNLHPFSFEEYLRYKDEKLYLLYKKKAFSQPVIARINKHYEEFILYGGYPRVAISDNETEKREVLKNIYNTYFLKEVKEIFQLSEDFKLSKLIKSLALQIGGQINYNELSSLTGFDYSDLLKHLNILIKTFICVESRPFFTNKRKEIVKSPKMFFLDNGFRNLVINNFQEIKNRPDAGALNENFVASEIVKKNMELQYWKTKAGAEVDFVVEKNSKIIPLEVKSTLNSPKITRSFRNFLNEYKSNKGLIFSYALNEKLKGKQLVIFSPLFSIAHSI